MLICVIICCTSFTQDLYTVHTEMRFNDKNLQDKQDQETTDTCPRDTNAHRVRVRISNILCLQVR